MAGPHLCRCCEEARTRSPSRVTYTLLALCLARSSQGSTPPRTTSRASGQTLAGQLSTHVHTTGCAGTQQEALLMLRCTPSQDVAAMRPLRADHASQVQAPGQTGIAMGIHHTSHHEFASASALDLQKADPEVSSISVS